MSGGFPANDDGGIVNALAIVNLQGAAGGAVVTVNPPPPNPYLPAAPPYSQYWGDRKSRDGGAFIFSEFKEKMKLTFYYNKEVGSIFTCTVTATSMKTFLEELYLTYLQFFKTNPLQYRTPTALNEGLFDPYLNYGRVKHFIVFPNLIHNGHYGFPALLLPKVPAAKNWLKFYSD
jgi:hypothetical protein